MFNSTVIALSPRTHRGMVASCFAVAASTCAVLAGDCLWVGLSAHHASHVPTFAVLLGLSAVLETYCARAAWRTKSQLTLILGWFVRIAIASLVAAYFLSLAVANTSEAVWMFAASFALLHSLTMLWITASPQALENLRRLTTRPIPRRSAQAAQCTIIMLVIGEVGLRLVFSSSDFLQSPDQGPRGGSNERQVEPSRELIPGTFRLAVIGGRSATGKSADTDYFVRLASSLPAVSLQDFTASSDSRRERAVLLDRALATKPDLIIELISIGGDLKQPIVRRGFFDWQSLLIVQMARDLLMRRSECEPPPITDAAEVLSDECTCDALLRARGAQLSICRTPMQDEMLVRWRATLTRLDHVFQRCRMSKVPLVLVVIPEGFQVNRILCETLRRREGYDPQELDLDLPQRRLAAFAQARNLPIFDLLPHLRLSDEPVYACGTESWNEHGTELAVQALGGWLRSRYGGVMSATAQLSSKQ